MILLVAINTIGYISGVNFLCILEGMFMAKQLNTMSVQELEVLIQKAQELISVKKAQADKLQGARAEIERIAREAGLSVADLMAQAGVKAVKPVSTRPPVAAKYRNSEDASQTWTGRGKRPRWLADAVAAGATLESFLI